MTTNSTINNTYFNISREGSEMTESPIIPLTLAQNYTRPQQPSHSTTGSREPDLDRWKSRVPKTGNSPLVPKPLFTSEKCVVEIEPAAATSEVPASISTTDAVTISSTPTSAAVPTTEIPTPISPSPSLFPVPPSTDGIVARPVTMTSPVSLHASNSVASRSSVYSQSTIGNTAIAARPRPVSSAYSQNTLTTVTATATSSPRTPTLTNWSSTLPGLQTSGMPLANAYAQPRAPVYMEQVTEEQPVHQHIQAQIQVPRLRSPSLPQDRANRRRTLSYTGGLNTHGRDSGSISSRPLVASAEHLSYPEIRTLPVDYERNDWPLQKPSVVHDIPHNNHVSRSQGSNISSSEPYSYHVANKESISSSSGQLAPQDPYVSSPRASMAESHTPIFGPSEQRSGWWSDEEDVEQAHNGASRYADVGMKEKPSAEAQHRRARNIKIIVAASILAILIIVGVAVGVTLGVRK
ncbi:hypothetical protein F4782DRAFT_486560 [Xylaria castorea]|nr:hypothetical protein F4782DRAFT_486560 [Xylaria castorea]